MLAIIPARAGSKGLPGKNLRPLCGKPLIVWSIEHALGTRGISDTIVSTDCPKIAQISHASGADVPFIRPKNLASDSAPTEPVMLHALAEMEKAGRHYDVIALLQPTSPFRYIDMTDRALVQLQDEGADSLLSVTESHAFSWRNHPVRADYDYRKRPRRQDIAPAARQYRETGSIYLTKTDVLLSGQNRLGGKITLFETPQKYSYEIDNLADFRLIETLMNEPEDEEQAA